MSTPEQILPTYDAIATEWERGRDKSLFERRLLDRMLAHAPGRRVLDLGCGSGRPIARYLADRRATVTGVDGAPAMIALFRRNLPGVEAVLADMRGLDLGRRFDAVLAFDSFFHLAPADQEAMFGTFAAHAAPRGVLVFTSGPDASERIGSVAGRPVYHASLSPKDYRRLLDAQGFDVIDFSPEDPDCAGHTVWMARARVTA